MVKLLSKRLLRSTADHVFDPIRFSPALIKLLEGGHNLLNQQGKHAGLITLNA
jgi:hypothetical protein